MPFIIREFNMIGREIYKIWAPAEAKWVDWVRPVPFVKIDEQFEAYEVGNFIIPNIEYIKELDTNTALIIDLPGNESIKEGLAIAKIGFRPIPIYNGTDEQKGARATVDNHSIKTGLVKGASELKKIKIEEDAPPAFLLDSNRMNRYKMNISLFDNSWDIYDQDLPTAEYLLKNNINKIIIRGEKIQKDLRKILYKFQEKGIKILFTNGYEGSKVVKIKKIIEKDK